MSLDLEQQLRESYAERLGAVDVSAGDVEAAQRRGARMRSRRRTAAAVSAAVVLVVGVVSTMAATGDRTVGPTGPQGQWHQLPAPPLSPRAQAAAVWTGQEFIVLGGDRNPCPPTADCIATKALRDGAAYDPSTNRWHTIAPAPVGVQPGDQLIAAGGRVLLSAAHRGKVSWYAYDPALDEWLQIPAFLGSHASSVGDRVYGFDRGRLRMYDARRGLWHERIPRDPIEPRLTERRVTATTYGPVVTGVDSTQPNDGRSPSLVLADLWDGHQWRRLPATGQIGNGFEWTGTRLVDPDPFSMDGGEVDNWGRSYPQGGRLDPATGVWSALPASLRSDSEGWIVNAAGGTWFATAGQVYDDATGRVSRLPRPDDSPDYGVAGAWADGRLLAFGGVDTSHGYSGNALTNSAWLWTP